MFPVSARQEVFAENQYYELFNAGKIGKTVFVADGFPLQKQ